MNNLIRSIAIRNLTKQAQGVAIRTPQQQAAYEKYMQTRRQNGQKILAHNKWYNKALNGLSDGWDYVRNFDQGFTENVTDGTFAANLDIGSRRALNAVADLAVNLPGDIAGATAYAGSYLKNLATGHGFSGSDEIASKTSTDAKDFVNNIGGDYSLGNAARAVKEYDAKLLNAYTDLNNIDPSNPGVLDSAGLASQHLAMTAFRDAATAGVIGKAIPSKFPRLKSFANPDMGGKLGKAYGWVEAFGGTGRSIIPTLDDLASQRTQQQFKIAPPRTFGSIDTGKALEELRKNKPTVKLTTDTSRQTK